MMSIGKAAAAAEEKPRRLGEEDAKNVARQLVDLEILYLLNFGPKSGYEFKKNLHGSFRLNISYGTLYPHLHSLEKSDLIQGTWQFQEENAPLKKRVYGLTPTGLEKLVRSISGLSKIAFTMLFMLTCIELTPRDSYPFERSEAAIRQAEEFLASLGYSVKKDVVARGYSGTEHTVDLYGSRLGKTSSQIERIVVKITASTNGPSIDDLLKTYVVSQDLSASKCVILSIPCISDEALKVAEFYHIPIYEGKDLSQAVSNMCLHFDGN